MRRGGTLCAFLLAAALSAAAQSTSVRLTVPQPQPPTTDTTVRIFPTLANEGTTDITSPITVEIEVRGGPYIGGENTDRWTCANHETPFRLRCITPFLRAGETLPVQIYIGPATEGNFEVRGTAFWIVGEERFFIFAIPRSARFPRQLLVTNAKDAGEGSLRAAIETLNGDCASKPVPCDVSFAFESDRPEVIAVASPLPPIACLDFRIDGTGAILDGSELLHGNGLEIVAAGPYVIRNLTVRGFPWDGIAVRRHGTLPVISAIEGNTLERNGSRGISFTTAGNVDVRGNRFRGNARSGIFVMAASSISIVENAAEGNGASGIFIGPSSYLTVVRNRVADNGQFGISIDRRAANLTLDENSIARNALLGIDRGLDGFDGYAYDDYDTSNAKIPPPRLASATYDAATNTTTIGGTYFDPVDYWGRWTITVYRNEEPGHQGDVILGHPVVKDGRFSMTVDGDLRGSYITANGGRYLNLGWSGDYAWPSEFSDWIEVH